MPCRYMNPPHLYAHAVTADKELMGSKQLGKGCIVTHITELQKAALLLTLLNWLRLHC